VVVVYFSTKDNGESKQPENVPTYTVSFDTNGAETEIQSVQVKQGEKIYKPVDPIYTGHYLENWKLNDTPWLFDYYTVYSNMTLKASWKYIEYQITLQFNEEGKEDQIIKYNIDDSFELDRPEKQGNIFVGWFDNNNNRVDFISQGTTGNMVLSARWVDNLVIKSLDESKGNIAVYADKDDPTKFTVKNVPVDNKYHTFKGWNINGVTHYEETCTFSTSLEEITYIESFYMDDNEETEWNLAHGVTPKLIDEKHVTYGMYPQDNVDNEDLINRLENSEITKLNNYYYDYGTNSYYVKETAKLARDFETGELLTVREFDNGDEIIEGEEYWFKVEPIKWRILKSDSDGYYLLSDKLIDVQKYDDGASVVVEGETILPNNYKHSFVREWLNDDFYNSVFYFNDLEIQTMEVDNSPESTATPKSGFSCENTFDKVTLLSFKEYTTPEYGFSATASNSITRMFYTTDYSRAVRANYSVENNSLFSGYGWTRSPIETKDNNGYCCSRNNKYGVLNEDYVGMNQACIQPALLIKF
jgi:uncharacterized repeat protein (TIGR02543 family)